MRLLAPGTRLHFLVLIVFGCISFAYSVPVAVAELCAVVLLYLYYRRANSRRQQDIVKYMENLTYHVDNATKDSLVNFPLPMVIVNIGTGEILWCNDLFYDVTGSREHLFETGISDVVPGFDVHWVIEGKNECPTEVVIGDRKYSVYGTLVRSNKERGRNLLCTLFWVDITEFSTLRKKFDDSRIITSIIAIDNYEELMKDCTDSEKSVLTAESDKCISEWTEKANGILRKYDRDKYLFVFERQYLDKMIEDKFSVLDEVRKLQNASGMSVTLSIAIGKEAEDFRECYQFASLALEMALSRGGDQAVVKGKYAFEFYGGQSQEVERRTKVKSRVMANALMQLMRDSSRILVMGHKTADIDSVGAAAGIVCMARKFGVPANIVMNMQNNSAKQLVSRLRTAEEYETAFMTPEDALLGADSKTLLVVVDTNRPEYVESARLLEAVNRIAVIDHHRRAADYIENCAINIHEPYASSTSELVAELLQYTVASTDILRVEAEAILAGIFLDTKGFGVKTGVRTFEAAAYLKRVGADMVEVKRLFQNNINDYMQISQIVSNTKVYRNDIAISVLNKDIERQIAAQAADELLNINGIAASFVIFLNGDSAIVSARSLGHYNVQKVVERLGGGGNITNAGVQIPNVDVDVVDHDLRTAIDEEYFSEEKDK